MKNMTEEAVVYTKDLCPYCNMAKDLLKKKNIKFKEINLISSPNTVEEMLKKSHGRKTVPQIFLGNKHIGGYDNLCEYLKTN